MIRRIDRSERISRLLIQVSGVVARFRGLPLMVGTGVLFLSFISFGVVILALVLSDNAPSVWLWICVPLTLLHLALFAVFTGVMLAVPLGESYNDSER
jgi:ABC-type polysaccharide/polyol phosphate export permease